MVARCDGEADGIARGGRDYWCGSAGGSCRGWLGCWYGDWHGMRGAIRWNDGGCKSKDEKKEMKDELQLPRVVSHRLSPAFLQLGLISNFFADTTYLHTNNEVVRKYPMMNPVGGYINYANHTDAAQVLRYDRIASLDNVLANTIPSLTDRTLFPPSHRSKAAPTTATTSPKLALNLSAPLAALFVVEVAAEALVLVAEACVEEAAAEPLPLSDT